MNVAVTGLNNVDSPGPGVPVVRALREAGPFDGRIIGLLYDALEPGAYLKDVVDAAYMIPYPSSGLENLFERIMAIHQKDPIDLIIPTLDSELHGFVKLAPRFQAQGIRTFLPSLEQLNLRAKDKLAVFCTSHDIHVPKNILISSVQDMYARISELTFPLFVKGIFYDAHRANNAEEAAAAFHAIRSKWGLPIILQEAVTGEEYNVVALGDGSGSSVGAVAMKKLYITDKGKAWAGVTIADDVLMGLTSRTMEALKWKGGMELEFVKDRQSNQYYLLEINPRFPAWVYLAVAAGQNLPYALLQLALGKSVQPFTAYAVGTIFIRYSWDFIADMKQFEALTVHGELQHA